MEPMDASPPPPSSSAEPEKAASPPPPSPPPPPPAEPPTTTTVPPSSSAIEITPSSASSSTLNPNPSSSQNPNPSSSQHPNGSPQASIPINQPISQSPFPQFSSASSSSSTTSSSSSSSSTPSQTLPSSASSSSAFSSSLPSSSAPPPFSAPSTSSSTSSFSTMSSSLPPSAPPPFSAPSTSSSSSASSFSMMSSSLPSSAPPPFSAASIPRGGLAIGVPAHQARPSLAQQQPSQPPPPPPPFSSFGPSSFTQQFGGLGRSSISVPESTANQTSAQVRPSMQSIGMMGSLSSGAQMRPSGLPLHHQQRMAQPSIRSQSPSSNQSLATQKFQNYGLLRGPSVTSPSSPSPTASQGLPSSSQPWMSAAPQLKQMPTPSLPSPSYRQPMRPQSLQQRPNHPQQHHHSMQQASHQQLSSTQPPQQQLQAVQSQDLYGQQFSQSRTTPSMAHQQVMRAAGPGNQKLSMPASVMAQLNIVPSVANVDDEESGNHILTKRSIRELVNQIGPSEKLDPEVEDLLMLVAEDFVDSITTYACSLAKHRKSTTLEAKDILLHLERNWNMTVPGFGGEEIKSYKKPFTSDIHKERLVAIKKSMQGSDAVSAKSTGGQATGNVKGHSTKVPSLGSP